MHSTQRLWTQEARVRKHLKLGPNIILAIMRHGCSILTATISRSFTKAKFNCQAWSLSFNYTVAAEAEQPRMEASYGEEELRAPEVADRLALAEVVTVV